MEVSAARCQPGLAVSATLADRVVERLQCLRDDIASAGQSEGWAKDGSTRDEIIALEVRMHLHMINEDCYRSSREWSSNGFKDNVRLLGVFLENMDALSLQSIDEGLEMLLGAFLPYAAGEIAGIETGILPDSHDHNPAEDEAKTAHMAPRCDPEGLVDALRANNDGYVNFELGNGVSMEWLMRLSDSPEARRLILMNRNFSC